MGEMSDLLGVLSESNLNKLNEIGVILRQYGYKGPALPTISKSADTAAIEVVGDDNTETKEGDETEDASEEVNEEEEKEKEGEEEEEEEEDHGAEEENKIVPEATDASDEGAEAHLPSNDPSSEEDFTTPPKPGSRPAKADTPPTPATPTLEGLSHVAKSVLRGSPLTSTKKFAREAKAHLNSAIKTPKRTSVSERLASLRAELSSVKKAEPVVARRSLSTRESFGHSSLGVRASLSARESLGRSSISFATATSFTPGARRRKFATTPHSDRRKPAPAVSTPSAPATPASPASPASPAAAPHVSPPAAEPTTVPITAQITSPAAATIPEEDTPTTVHSAGSCSSGTPETPDFDSPPNTFTATGKAAATCKPVQSINNEIAQEKIESPAQTPAPVNTAVDASPSTPTMSSLPKTPMTKPLATPNPDEMTPPASTPECPVFSTVKKLPPSQSKVAVSQSKDQELSTPLTPPLPTKLHSLSAKKAVKECIPMEKEIVKKNPAMESSVNSLATPPMIPLTMSTKKSARAYARLSAAEAEKKEQEDFKSPVQGTPEVPPMRASTVTKPARSVTLAMPTPDIDSLAVFDSPDVSSPAEPTFAVSTVKKAASTSKGAGGKDVGKTLKFGSPEVSTPPIPSLAASAVKASGKGRSPATPVELQTGTPENCPPSNASTGTPATPPDINDSLSFSFSNKKAIKEFARSLSLSSRKAPMSDVSSFGSPATPPIPPVSRTKKKNVTLGSPPSTPLLERVASKDTNSVGSTPPVPPMSSTKNARKPISPPSTPLLASASKAQIERRERRGEQEEESPGKVVELFSGKVDEEEVVVEQEADEEERLIADITKDEYNVAPRLVKMQAKLDPLNTLIANMNKYFKDNKTTSIPEPKAITIAKKRMMLMGLVHFGKLVISESKTNKGEKEYVVVA